MFHLIYKSNQTQKFSPADLKTLLMKARLRNGAVGVTGILVYHGGTFLQALEGERAAVETTFARITKDPRHGDIHALSRKGSVGKMRMFGEWSMAFADNEGVAKILKGFIDLKGDVSLSHLTEVQALDILRACSQPSMAAAS